MLANECCFLILISEYQEIVDLKIHVFYQRSSRYPYEQYHFLHLQIPYLPKNCDSISSIIQQLQKQWFSILIMQHVHTYVLFNTQFNLLHDVTV